MTEIQKKACDVINTFLQEFADNPFNYLYESDIRAVLYTRLYDAFAENKFRVPLHPKKYEKIIPSNQYTNPVKTEYLKPLGLPFDIGIVDRSYDNEKLSKQYNNLRNENFWILPLSMAIEIKYAQLGDSFSSSFKGLKGDLSKIENYIKRLCPTNFYGLGLLFFQYDICINESNIMDMCKKINVEEVDTISCHGTSNGYIIIPQSGIIKVRILKVKIGETDAIDL